MSQANIPNITPIISVTMGQVIPLLLSSIALEEIALAHIVNAEAEKIQFVLGTLNTSNVISPTTITISNLLTINQSVSQTLKDVIKKEMLLQFKLENVLKLNDQSMNP
jgi:predicted transcriptional regulator